jgi:hypothetical protein
LLNAIDVAGVELTRFGKRRPRQRLARKLHPTHRAGSLKDVPFRRASAKLAILPEFSREA